MLFAGKYTEPMAEKIVLFYERAIQSPEEDDIMKRKMIQKLIAMSLCGVMLAGCGVDDVEIPYQPADVQIAQDEPGVSYNQADTGKEDGENGEKESKFFTPVEFQGTYARAAYLADMVYEGNGSVNIMVSPLSMDMALGLVSGGAGGQTKEELLNYLGTDDYGLFAEQYMEYAEGLNTDPTSSQRPTYYKSAFEIANSVWVKDDRKLVAAYADKAREQYDAEIRAVSFDKAALPGTVKQINDWCNEKTHELIPEIVGEESFSQDAAAVLINSLYFEAPWSEDWRLTTDRFTDFGGNTTEQEMLQDTLTTYYENNYATAFAKDYRNGMKFIGILPKETGEFALTDLDVESLLESKSTAYDVQAMMPKLTFDTTANNIVDILKAQGVATVFDNQQADLTGLIEMQNGEVCYISDIIQRTRIELDEKGTKAAAVTAVMANMCTTALPVEKEIKQVYLDRPFAFMIYDEVNEQIVFVGKVVTI